MPGWSLDDAAAVRARVGELTAELPDLELASDHDHTQHTRLLNRGKGMGWLMVDHHGDGRLSLWLKSDREEQAALVGQDPGRYFVPPYVGAAGWIGVDVAPATEPDWDEIAALLRHAWRLTARRTVLRAYDATHQLDGPPASQ